MNLDPLKSKCAVATGSRIAAVSASMAATLDHSNSVIHL
jgi:hypothetical protein